MILKEYGFLTESVIDGNYAVEAVKTHPAGYYDLILMDIQMPIMDGYEATRQIRAIDREDIPALPILALSANAREEDHHKSLDSGMNTHIAKPFEITSLIQTINRYLSK
jgi:CheY-like chemotaxis protein